ncbi:uncharacterized protein C16orf78 homolog [Vombatus ursinus]|uniref:uncharacterized protein C16orf78 homolog n=1 Tax=Vombatus ursinus TaxID=29139 RepID=UPI000FFD3B58|nr:uncharacterized protein C16orf78 homolog [Vombatus ursinus]
MSNLAPWSSFSPHIPDTTEQPSTSSSSAKGKRKSLYHVKPTEDTKMSDLKSMKWDATKQKTGGKGAKEKKQPDMTYNMEKLEQKQGKSLAVAPTKENYQLFLRNSLKQGKKSPEESIGIQDPYLTSFATLKDANKKLIRDLDDPEIVIAVTPRMNIPRRNSTDTNASTFMQDTFSSSRKGTITKVPDPSSSFQGHDQKIKNLIEKTPSVKPETSSMLLKPQEVLSCRYLRLSKNNVQTLINLCKDSGMDVDIHPHMNESEMNANKIFSRKHNTAL